MRAAVAHREAKPLVGTEDDVSTPFSGRCQKGEAHQVSAYTHEGAGAMNLFNQLAVVTYLAAGSGVLNNHTKQPRIYFNKLIINKLNVNPQRSCTGDEHITCLSEDKIVNQEEVCSRLHLVART